ncbi:hypothetical protein HLH36_19180 [Gluconacetobacter aggeris]|uniref:Uncharacterized protein n=1 Tax=Gluconacetobacter aggeris TaxID=1286186 RepID=A0A7W4NYC6_9PROT|nr:hypothetical protein [Gluconacetobacter aggeris]MBB2170429.1 hypothetical protein [Gluconacetobacter aggeris]
MNDHALAFLLITILVLVVIVLIFGMKYFSSARSVRLQINSEGAYRDLAARSIKTQEDGVSGVSATKRSIAEIERRLANIEKVLKEVD